MSDSLYWMKEDYIVEQEKLLLSADYNPQLLASNVKRKFEEQRRLREANRREDNDSDIPEAELQEAETIDM